MDIKIYRSTTLQGTRTDISDDIRDIQGLSWKRDIDHRYVIPHPTLIIDTKRNLAVDDYIHFEIDSEIRLCTYISKIEKITGKHANKVECWDVLKKLGDTHIGLVSSTWFSSDTWWINHPAQVDIYKHVGSGSGYLDEHYIQALFLVQIMLKKCVGFDLSDYQINQTASVSSKYKGYHPGTGAITLQNKEILFQWYQLRSVGKSASTETLSKSATCLEVFNWIVRIMEIKFYYETISGNIHWRMTTYGTPVIPTNDDDGYSEKDLPVYDGTGVSLSQLSSLAAYYSAWSTLTNNTEESPSAPTENNKYKKTSIIKHLELHYKQRYGTLLKSMGIYGTGTDLFLKQYADILEVIYIKTYKKKSFDLELEEDRDCLENIFDIKNRSVKNSYLYEVP